MGNVESKDVRAEMQHQDTGEGCVGKEDMSDTDVQRGGCPRTPMTHKVLETALPRMRETDVS